MANSLTYNRTKIHFSEGAAAATPDATEVVIYAKADGLLYSKDDAGVETLVSGGGAGSSDLAGKELDYVQITANVTPTATTEGTADTVVTGSAVAYDGATIVLIEFFTMGCRPAIVDNATMKIVLYDGASSIGELALQQSPGAAHTSYTGSMYQPVLVARRLTPSAATHTYSIRAYVSSGTGVILAGAGGSGAQAPAFIRITRVSS